MTWLVGVLAFIGGLVTGYVFTYKMACLAARIERAIEDGTRNITP